MSEPGRAFPVTNRAGPGAAAGPGMPRLLATVRPDGRPLILQEHLQAVGRLPPLSQDVAYRMVADSGLRGRGGAGFPVARKVRSVLDTGGRPIVVVNGAAGIRSATPTAS